MDWGNDDPVVGKTTPTTAAAPTSAASSWGNDDPVASQQTLIPTQSEGGIAPSQPGPLSIQGAAAGGIPSAVLGAGGAFDAGLVNAAKVVPMAAGGLAQYMGLPQAAQDVPFSAVKAMSDYADPESQQAEAANPTAATVGSVASILPQLALAPETAEGALGANASRIAKAFAGIKHGAPVAAALGTEQATDNAISAIKQGVPVDQAEKLYGVTLGASTLANLLPAGAGGNIATRALTGAAANALGGSAAQEAEHLSAPNVVPQPTLAGTGKQGLVGAVLGSVLGHSGARETPETANWGNDDQIITPPQATPAAPEAPVVPPAQAEAQQAAQTATAQVGGGATASNLVAKNAAEAGLAPADVAAHVAGADAMVKADPDAEVPLHPATPIDATTSVPLGGGGSKDNSVNFIDKRIPQFIDVPKPDGTTVQVDAHDVIANAHEAPEKTQLDEGKDYADAHNVNANNYEEAFLQSKYGVTHDAFNEALKPYLDKAETEGAGASDISPNLDTKPYVDDGVEHLLDPNASKVVDDKGEPLTVYHGTANDFSEFADHSGESTAHATSPLGHFFTPDRASAEGYARNASEGRPADERVMQAQLDIKKPYEMPLDEAQAIETPDQARQVRAHLEAQGYDGIHLPDQNAWVAFHPHQISLTGDNEPFHVEQQATREAVANMAPEDRAAAVQSLGLDIAPHHEAEALSIADLVDKAVDAGAHPKDIIAAMTGTPAEKARKLWSLAHPGEDHVGTENTQSTDVQPDRARSAEPADTGTAGDHADGGPQARVPGADSNAVDSAAAGERPAEPEPTEDRVDHTTSIKNDQVNAERAAKEKDALETTQKLSDEEAHTEAKARLKDDPEAGAKLAQDILDNPRAPSKVEDMMLALDRQRIETELRESSQQISDAMNSGDKDAESFARMRQAAADSASDINDLASRAAGTESGRSLQGRKAAIAEDYSLSRLLNEARAANGGKLSDEQRTLFEDHAKRIADLEKQLAERDIPRGRRKPVAMGDKKAAMDEFNRIAADMRRKTAENPRSHCEI